MPTYDVYYANPTYAALAGHPRVATVEALTPKEAVAACRHLDVHGAGLIAVPRGAPNPGRGPDGWLTRTDPASFPGE